MKKTPNIGLTEVGNSYIDKDMDFEEWRLLVAGEDSSNMSIIDKEIGDLKKIVKTEGTGEKYLADDGTYRYVSGGGGTSKVAFASDNYLVYTATANTTTFTISNMDTSKSVELIKDNMVMMQGQEYTIDKSTGVVTLSFTLNEGEKIYYNVIEGEEKAVLYSDVSMIESNREKYLTDINRNFIAPRTTIAAVDGLSENILSTQKQINVLSGRNYLPSSVDGTTDYDTSTKPSDYKSNSFSVTKLKKCSAVGINSSFGYWADIVCISTHGGSNCHEVAITSNDYILLRTQVGTEDSWGEWKLITGHTIDLTAYLVNGWVNYSGGFKTINASRIGNLIKVGGLIKGGVTTSGTTILQLPTGWRPTAAIICPHWLANGNIGRLNLNADGTLTIGTDGIPNSFLQIDLTFIL